MLAFPESGAPAWWMFLARVVPVTEEPFPTCLTAEPLCSPSPLASCAPEKSLGHLGY